METVLRRLRQRIRISDITTQELAICVREIIEYQDDFLSSIKTTIDNEYYIKCFLQKLINVIEDIPSILGEYDFGNIYSAYILLISVTPPPVDKIENIHYSLAKSPINDTYSDIIIKETPNLINGFGCTGYRTWEASLFICEYLLRIPNIFSLFPKFESKKTNRSLRIVELGAGTGLLSVFIKKNFDTCFSDFYVTDGETKVVDRIKEMFILNNTSTEKVDFQRLWWGPDVDGSTKIPENDLIVAADVTYDVSLIPLLVYTLEKSLFANVGSIALVSSAVRNESTVQLFEESLKEKHLSYEIVFKDKEPGESFTKYNVFFPKKESEMRVYKITADP